MPRPLLPPPLVFLPLKKDFFAASLTQYTFSSILNDALLTEYAKRNKEVAAKKGEQNKREEKNVVKEKNEEKEEKKEDPVEEEEEYSLPIDEEDQLYEVNIGYPVTK